MLEIRIEQEEATLKIALEDEDSEPTIIHHHKRGEKGIDQEIIKRLKNTVYDLMAEGLI